MVDIKINRLNPAQRFCSLRNIRRFNTAIGRYLASAAIAGRRHGSSLTEPPHIASIAPELCRLPERFACRVVRRWLGTPLQASDWQATAETNISHRTQPTRYVSWVFLIIIALPSPRLLLRHRPSYRVLSLT